MQYVGTALTVAAGATAVAAYKSSGDYDKIAYEERAKSEADAARDREIDRRRRLVSALSSQNAEAGAVGAAPGIGSRKAIALSDARRASYESLADKANTGRRSLMLRAAGKQAKRQGTTNALVTAMGTAEDTIEGWPG